MGITTFAQDQTAYSFHRTPGEPTAMPSLPLPTPFDLLLATARACPADASAVVRWLRRVLDLQPCPVVHAAGDLLAAAGDSWGAALLPFFA